MPLYDIECEACDCYDAFFKLAQVEAGGLRCPQCGSPARILPNFGGLVGPTDTKPLLVNNMDAALTSASQVRAFERKHKLKVGSTGESRLSSMKERVTERLDRRCKSQGYRDHKHRRAEINKRQRMDHGAPNGTD